MSPLQYRKRLRLQEARRLMRGEGLDAAEAAFRVGYESPSQFSREYRRLFGAPPRQDVAALKVQTQPTTEWFVADLAGKLGIPKKTQPAWLRRGWVHYLLL